MAEEKDKVYVVFYRDDFKSDFVFDQYCGMLSAIVSDDRESVKFDVNIKVENGTKK